MKELLRQRGFEELFDPERRKAVEDEPTSKSLHSCICAGVFFFSSFSSSCREFALLETRLTLSEIEVQGGHITSLPQIPHGFIISFRTNQVLIVTS